MNKNRYSANSISIGLFFVTAFLVASLFYPSWVVLRRAFIVDHQLSLQSFFYLFQDRFALLAVVNSLVVAILCCIFTWIFSVPISIAIERLHFKGKGFIELVILAPLFLPPFVGVVGLRGLFGSVISPQASSSLILIALLQALHMYPLIYLNLRSVLASIPSGLHEAAKLNGFSTTIIWKLIDYGLLKGAIVGSMIFVFVGSITDVGTPLLLERRDFISTSIFQTLVDAPPQGAGYALCVLVLLLSVFSFLFANIFEKKFPGVIDARISRVAVPTEYGLTLKYCVLVIFTALIACLGVLPHLTVIILALSEYWFLTVLPTSYTLGHFSEVFLHPLSKSSLVYSLFLASVASVICLVIGLWVAWRAARIGGVWDRLLEASCLLPLAVPGIVIAFGMVLGYAGTWIDNRQNPTILLIMAYAVRKLPFMVRVAKSAILLIPKGLEEAATLAGASTGLIIRSIIAPLLKPAIVAGLFLSFTGSLLEVSDSLLLPMEEKFYPITKALYSLQARPDGVSLSASYALIVMASVITILLLASKLSGKKITELLRGTA